MRLEFKRLSRRTRIASHFAALFAAHSASLSAAHFGRPDPADRGVGEGVICNRPRHPLGVGTDRILPVQTPAKPPGPDRDALLPASSAPRVHWSIWMDLIVPRWSSHGVATAQRWSRQRG